MSESILARIKQMNEMMRLPINEKPTDLGDKRIDDLYFTLRQEVKELLDIDPDGSFESKLVALADLLADMIVYCMSESVKWGIPIIPVLHAVIDSQESKLDENGNPIFDERGKFLKGPNYQPPEPAIHTILFGEGE